MPTGWLEMLKSTLMIHEGGTPEPDACVPPRPPSSSWDLEQVITRSTRHSAQSLLFSKSRVLSRNLEET